MGKSYRNKVIFTAKVLCVAAISLFLNKALFAGTVPSNLSKYDDLTQKLSYETEMEKTRVDGIDEHTLVTMLHNEENTQLKDTAYQPNEIASDVINSVVKLNLIEETNVSFISQEINLCIKEETALFQFQVYVANSVNGDIFSGLNGKSFPGKGNEKKDNSGKMLLAVVTASYNQKTSRDRADGHSTNINHIENSGSFALHGLDLKTVNERIVQDNYALFLYLQQKNPDDLNYNKQFLFPQSVSFLHSFTNKTKFHNNTSKYKFSSYQGKPFIVSFCAKTTTHFGESI